MKLWEALKTGRRIKLANDETYRVPYAWCLDKDRIEADDWEVEPEPKKQSRLFLWDYQIERYQTPIWLMDNQWMTKEQAERHAIRRISSLCPEGIESSFKSFR